MRCSIKLYDPRVRRTAVCPGAAIQCDGNELTRHVFTVEEITGRMRAEEGLFRYADNVDNVHGHIEEQVGALL